MNFRILKKLENQRVAFLTMTLLFLVAGILASLSFWFLRENTSEVARFYLGENSKNLAQNLDGELRNVVEKARLAWGYAASKSDAKSDRRDYLHDAMKSIPGIQSVEHFSREGTVNNAKWRSSLYQPFVNEPYRSIDDLDFEFATKGFVEIQTYFDASELPYIRLVVPIKRAKFTTPKEIITVEVSSDWLKPFFKSSSNIFHFLVDQDGRLIAQTDTEHFKLGDNLSHLVVVQQTQESEDSNLQLNYKEMPDSETQLAAFHKIGESGLTIISQVNETSNLILLKKHRGSVMWLGFALMLIAFAACLWIANTQKRMHHAIPTARTADILEFREPQESTGKTKKAA